MAGLVTAPPLSGFAQHPTGIDDAEIVIVQMFKEPIDGNKGLGHVSHLSAFRMGDPVPRVNP